jgi:hypothetical protein
MLTSAGVHGPGTGVGAAARAAMLAPGESEGRGVGVALAVAVAGSGLPKETLAVVLRADPEVLLTAGGAVPSDGVACAVADPPPQAAANRARTPTAAGGAPRIAPLYGFHSGQGGARRRPAIPAFGMNMLSFCCTYNW